MHAAQNPTSECTPLSLHGLGAGGCPQGRSSFRLRRTLTGKGRLHGPRPDHCRVPSRDRLPCRPRGFHPLTTKAAGLSRRALQRLTAEGLLRRPVRGVYVATELGDSLALRAECLRLISPPDAVIVDRHAGWLHGAEMVLRPNEHLELRPVSMFLPARGGRLRNPLADSGERSFRKGDVVEINGLRVTSPLRTACDLGRVRWPEDAISALDAMLRLGLFTREQLIVEVERFRGMRWVRTLRGVAPLADGRAQGPGESVLRLRCIKIQLEDCNPSSRCGSTAD